MSSLEGSWIENRFSMSDLNWFDDIHMARSSSFDRIYIRTEMSVRVVGELFIKPLRMARSQRCWIIGRMKPGS